MTDQDRLLEARQELLAAAPDAPASLVGLAKFSESERVRLEASRALLAAVGWIATKAGPSEDATPEQRRDALLQEAQERKR